MIARLRDRLAAVRSAIVAGDPSRTMDAIEEFVALARKKGLEPADKARLDAELVELRVLAEASMKGARQALDEIQAIVAAARSLQTYDDRGCRQVASTAAPAPHRF